MSRQDFYKKFREDYPTFTYQGYSYDLNDSGISMTFDFSIDGLSEFHPTWSIPRINRIDAVDEELIDEMVFSLGMVELVSYWKIACPPTVIIKDRKLSTEQIGWWKKLYFNGLGEFYYTNGIEEDFDDFMTIQCDGTKESYCNSATYNTTSLGSKQPRVMIPVGGGKDSVVSIELLLDKADVNCYVINSRGATDATVEVGGLTDRTIYAKRTLDKNMLDLNAKGFLNGHTPFSALVAFSSIIAGYLNGLDFVALSNESSANESTVADSYVNHQYSKSFEFEADFRRYERQFIGSGVFYFSFLRPLSELQIAMLFSRFKKYHGIFKSCNVGSKQDIWCGHCPKCLFVYIILSPFLSLAELDAIFGKRLFEDETLMKDFDKLCGILPEKPFECVGSRDEVNAAITESISRYAKDQIPLPVLLMHYQDSSVVPAIAFDKYKNQFSSEHALDEYFEKIIKDALANEGNN
ncbi:hypothetical protein [Pseudobutyrivibrio xylanivorans]|uniref:UDP-N-acetyl-alpha-D-muramoyl-L-alanyl-L-glutamate epimerase n=1 Tax=Pseudobutyrivibrio xylanivorans TaxID=185007 RepID=A0A5P6VQ87_PSEXY|nr:hypothetical protein [Pseudobutyrivibrio xylanivorans]QFJ54836.1 hypothetical protein FXF36_08205 [Pseudobutyrivibrio xylanivorans]